MERFSQRESVLLGYSPRSSFINDAASPSLPHRNSDIDFNDVFGGPPRRSSMHETRYSFNEATDQNSGHEHDEAAGWNGLSEKPVFGEEVLNRRRHQCENFFDDIFKGNECLSSSPRKRDWDPYSSSPSSRVLSPARPLPPKAEPFGSSLPAQFRFWLYFLFLLSSLSCLFFHPVLIFLANSNCVFLCSLPAKLTIGTELATFASTYRSPYRSKDGASNGMNLYPSTLSRSSSLNLDQEERTDARSFNRQSLLSRELSDLTNYDGTDTGSDSKKESDNSKALTNKSQFHFSIYKWAGKGVPLPVALAMPIRGGNSSRLKENSDANGSSRPDRWIASERMAKELPEETLLDNKSFEMEHSKQDNGLPSIPQRVGSDNSISQSTAEETQFHSQSEMGLSDKRNEIKSVIAEEGRQSDLKPLFSLFFDNDFEQSE